MLDNTPTFLAEEQEKQLEKYFSITIPRLLEHIKEKDITHILLLEKTARIFKAPLTHLFRKRGIDVKVGSFAPDYFPYIFKQEILSSLHRKQQEVGLKQYKKKLGFLPNPEGTNYNILVLDDFIEMGSAITKTMEGLNHLGYSTDRLFAATFDGANHYDLDVKMLYPDRTIARVICNHSRKQENFYGKCNTFELDEHSGGVYYAQRNTQYPDRFGEVIKSLTRMILESVG